jgi:anaerobic dimethyl sulfoxide reductase subunit B (iron-sulfur subunit)
MTYAFTFDASACSGCKACQVACKDKNDLPVGVLWRRVYEISGGEWTNVGARSSRPGAGEPSPYNVWENTIFAYNLTIACNHCVHPKCAGVCPTDAYVVRDDGVVYIDESKCMGCGYCSWACPYAAPQYNPEAGQMTKCDFCYDNLDMGMAPTCVTACPMRVLDFENVHESNYDDRGVALWEVPAETHPYPLPGYSHTEPHLAIQSHSGMLNDLEKTVANQEEIQPKKVKSEMSLVAFTLLTQMAAGMAVFELFSGPLTMSVLTIIGLLLGIGGLISFLHLGRPLSAWRALNHLKKSWLSRETLMFGLFGLSWLLCWIMPGMGKLPLAIFGIGLVYSMAKVYRLRSIPAWDSSQTLLAFSVSAVVLGGLGLEIFAPSTFQLLLVGIGLGAAFWLSLSEWTKTHETGGRFRLGLIALALVGVAAMFFVPNTVRAWLIASILLLALIEEIIGRWLFYGHLQNRPL